MVAPTTPTLHTNGYYHVESFLELQLQVPYIEGQSIGVIAPGPVPQQPIRKFC